MNIARVHTADGIATYCGDVIYRFRRQIVTPFHEIQDAEPRTTGNHGTASGRKRPRSRSS